MAATRFAYELFHSVTRSVRVDELAGIQNHEAQRFESLRACLRGQTSPARLGLSLDLPLLGTEKLRRGLQFVRSRRAAHRQLERLPHLLGRIAARLPLNAL